MSRIGGFSSQGSKVVYVNVYDLHEHNDLMYQFGLGMYHSGVHIGREEYTFASGSGIFSHEPKQAPGARLRESIEIGVYNGTSRELSAVINELRSRFGGDDYNLLTRNCNTFADELLRALMNKELPSYVNRLATLGSYVSCLLPPSITGEAPVQADGQGSVSSGTPHSRNSAPASVSAFGGTGVKLGRTDGVETTAPDNGLNDRRERMRMAALARVQG